MEIFCVGHAIGCLEEYVGRLVFFIWWMAEGQNAFEAFIYYLLCVTTKRAADEVDRC